MICTMAECIWQAIEKHQKANSDMFRCALIVQTSQLSEIHTYKIHYKIPVHGQKSHNKVNVSDQTLDQSSAINSLAKPK